ncbi:MULTISPECIES: hypothetical protein [unclassified Nocardiopsis]|uniref:hypothetical protein n=1 Tax=unclassified Nocardiopsis TaxID=2649073 RepID=UPI00130116E9|nr:hypothetical protein [Nocardiopsis sp. TSRI0078]
MIPHTPEAVTRRRRDPSAPGTDAPPLAPGDLVPHLRGLARALRDRGADRTARGPASSR